MAEQDGVRTDWPMRAYFVAIALLVIALGTAVGGYMYARSNSDARHSALADARFAASKGAAQLTAGIRILNPLAVATAADPTTARVFTHPKQCQFGYAPVGAFETGVIDMIRRDGSVACGSGAATPGRPFAGQPWLTARAIVAPVFDPGRHRRVAVLSYPVGRVGALAFLLDLAPIGPKLADEFGSGVHKLEFLVLERNTIIARSIAPETWIGKQLAVAPATSGRDLDGTRRWYASVPVDGTSWRVYVGADQASALAASAGLRNTELGIVAGGVAAVLLALGFVYRRVARPIRSLSTAVRSGAEPIPAGGPEEVRQLADDVNGFISAIKSSEESYRRLFDGSPLAMVVYDEDTGRILEANDAALRLYVYAHDEIVDLNVREIAMAEERSPLEPSLHLRKGGTAFQARVTAHPTSFAGRSARFLMVEDVSERRRLEAQLQHAQRMEVIGRLAAGIAHDFNNILTVIGGTSALMLRELGGRDDPTARERLRQIERATQHAAELTQQLLAFGRQQVLKPEPTDVNAVLAETLPLVARILREDIQLVQELDPRIAPTMVDRSQLQQVILNLCVNARDAMPDGGTLVVRTANIELDSAYAGAHIDVPTGRYSLLEITDSGVGMTAETASRIFEPFFTTKETGTGLGLATVHGIVKQSGGNITVYSEPDLGTTFRVYLPQASAANVPDAEVPDASSLEGDETILFVEDAELLRPLAAEILESYGYTVLVAANGVEALDVARRHPGEIDLLLTDAVMPEMNGRELADRLAASRPAVKVLFTSGYPADTALRAGIARAQLAYIQKPYVPAALARAIRETLDSEATAEATPRQDA